MLAYIHHRGTAVSRRDLADLIWSGAEQAAATNLRSMLRRFQIAFADSDDCPLDIGPTEIALRPGSLDYDLADAMEGDLAIRLERLSEAVSRGFLAAEVIRSGRIGRWITEVRLSLVGNLRQTLLDCQAVSVPGLSRTAMKRAAMLLLDEDPHDKALRSALSLLLDQPHSQNLREMVERPAYPQLTGSASNAASLDIVLTSNLELPRVALLPPDIAVEAVGSGDLANALIEDLTIGLCASHTVSVVAPYTAEKIRASADKVGLLRQHQVLYALDTRRSGDQLFAQLIFLPADEVVWATRFRLKASDPVLQRLEIADAIQTSIVEHMRRPASPIEGFKATPDAYYAYLSGLQSLSQVSLPSLRRARKRFRDALSHDKNLSIALAGLSRTLSMEWVLTARGDADLLTEAERLAKRAIEINGTSAMGFKELGVSQLYKGGIDDSLAALGEAERLSPHYADAIFSHADSLTHASQPAAAREKINLAISLNPMPPDTYYWAAAGASYFLQEFGQALSYIDHMQDKQPATRLAAACHAMLGDTSRARLYRNRFLSDNPGFELEQWLAMVPHKEEWQTELYRQGLIKAGFKGN